MPTTVNYSKSRNRNQPTPTPITRTLVSFLKFRLNFLYQNQKGILYGNEVELKTGEGHLGVEGVEIDDSSIGIVEIARYDIHGRRLTKSSPGFNIVIYSNGTTRKEIVK